MSWVYYLFGVLLILGHSVYMNRLLANQEYNHTKVITFTVKSQPLLLNVIIS